MQMTLAKDFELAINPVKFARLLDFNPDPWQARAISWRGKRAIWDVARQSGKSTVAALLALHRAIYYPKSLILLVSPSLRQSSELFRKVTDWIDRLPEEPKLDEDNKLSCTFPNGSRILSLPSSEATIRGFSAVNLIIEDEASRVDDNLYRSVRPMLAVSHGKIILMSTPFGKRGHFFEEWENGGNTWERIRITAEENPRITKEFLEEEKRSLGEFWYKQEYLCEFVESVDQVFGYDLIMNAISTEVKPLFEGF